MSFAWPETWGRFVRLRASGICELCGAGRLWGYTMTYPEETIIRIDYIPGCLAHHILPTRHFPLFADHPANGIAVCDHCHGKIHGGRRSYAWAAIDCIHWIPSTGWSARLNAMFRDVIAGTLSDGSYYDLVHLFGRAVPA